MYQTLQAEKPVKIWVEDLSEVESSALDQLRNSAKLPWVEGIAVMPDVHAGKGATVGSVILSRGALSPSIVGVDIGCGMSATQLPYKMNDIKNFSETVRTIRSRIEAVIPVGFYSNEKVSKRADKAFDALGRPTSIASDDLLHKARSQLGTLGGGNHFIEMCSDENENVWMMLHSGSRNIGKELAERHIKTAKGMMGDLVKMYGDMWIEPELAALVEGTQEYKNYIHDLFYAQAFAKANREEMRLKALREISIAIDGVERSPQDMTIMRVDCHHNYVEFTEEGAILTRKGAVSARKGELGIIPGSMGAKSFIVRGLGNEESYCSCSHGAGRRMSRGQAKREFTQEDLIAQTEGVECRKDIGVLDEIPGAYKDIDRVMYNQRDLVEAVATLKQFMCVKG